MGKDLDRYLFFSGIDLIFQLIDKQYLPINANVRIVRRQQGNFAVINLNKNRMHVRDIDNARLQISILSGVETQAEAKQANNTSCSGISRVMVNNTKSK